MPKSRLDISANSSRICRESFLEALHVFTPPPKMTVSEWADDRRSLSAESAAEPGKWNTGRVG